MKRNDKVTKKPKALELLARLTNRELASEWMAISNLGYGGKAPKDELALRAAISTVKNNPDEPEGAVRDESRSWRKNIDAADKFTLEELHKDVPFLFTPERKGPRMVYTAVITKKGVKMGLVVEGEAGYHPTKEDSDLGGSYKSYAEAKEVAAEMNKRGGYTPEEVAEVVASSIGAQHRAEEQE